MDRHKRKTKTTDAASDSVASNRLADMKSTVLSLAVTAMQCVLFSVCAAIPVLTVQYVTFILQVINRSFMYGGNAAFIAITFPSRHFGKIYGLTLALSAVVSLLQYPFYALVKGPLNDDPMYMNISFVILVTLAIAHPVIVYLHCQRETRLGAGTTLAQVEVPGLGEKDEPMASDIDI
uniref:equilibrative nucleobase transporter 1-like n=1 Tax=Pristiophorus japonicus TaxID=55135 RepID=UPI00398F4489